MIDKQYRGSEQEIYKMIIGVISASHFSQRGFLVNVPFEYLQHNSVLLSEIAPGNMINDYDLRQTLDRWTHFNYININKHDKYFNLLFKMSRQEVITRLLKRSEKTNNCYNLSQLKDMNIQQLQLLYFLHTVQIDQSQFREIFELFETSQQYDVLDILDNINQQFTILEDMMEENYQEVCSKLKSYLLQKQANPIINRAIQMIQQIEQGRNHKERIHNIQVLKTTLFQDNQDLSQVINDLLLIFKQSNNYALWLKQFQQITNNINNKFLNQLMTARNNHQGDQQLRVINWELINNIEKLQFQQYQSQVQNQCQTELRKFLNGEINMNQLFFYEFPIDLLRLDDECQVREIVNEFRDSKLGELLYQFDSVQNDQDLLNMINQLDCPISVIEELKQQIPVINTNYNKRQKLIQTYVENMTNQLSYDQYLVLIQSRKLINQWVKEVGHVPLDFDIQLQDYLEKLSYISALQISPINFLSNQQLRFSYMCREILLQESDYLECVQKVSDVLNKLQKSSLIYSQDQRQKKIIEQSQDYENILSTSIRREARRQSIHMHELNKESMEQIKQESQLKLSKQIAEGMRHQEQSRSSARSQKIEQQGEVKQGGMIRKLRKIRIKKQLDEPLTKEQIAFLYKLKDKDSPLVVNLIKFYDQLVDKNIDQLDLDDLEEQGLACDDEDIMITPLTVGVDLMQRYADEPNKYMIETENGFLVDNLYWKCIALYKLNEYSVNQNMNQQKIQKGRPLTYGVDDHLFINDLDSVICVSQMEDCTDKNKVDEFITSEAMIINKDILGDYLYQRMINMVISNVRSPIRIWDLSEWDEEFYEALEQAEDMEPLVTAIIDMMKHLINRYWHLNQFVINLKSMKDGWQLRRVQNLMYCIKTFNLKVENEQLLVGAVKGKEVSISVDESYYEEDQPEVKSSISLLEQSFKLDKMDKSVYIVETIQQEIEYDSDEECTEIIQEEEVKDITTKQERQLFQYLEDNQELIPLFKAYKDRARYDQQIDDEDIQEMGAQPSAYDIDEDEFVMEAGKIFDIMAKDEYAEVIYQNSIQEQIIIVQACLELEPDKIFTGDMNGLQDYDEDDGQQQVIVNFVQQMLNGELAQYKQFVMGLLADCNDIDSQGVWKFINHHIVPRNEWKFDFIRDISDITKDHDEMPMFMIAISPLLNFQHEQSQNKLHKVNISRVDANWLVKLKVKLNTFAESNCFNIDKSGLMQFEPNVISKVVQKNVKKTRKIKKKKMIAAQVRTKIEPIEVMDEQQSNQSIIFQRNYEEISRRLSVEQESIEVLKSSQYDSKLMEDDELQIIQQNMADVANILNLKVNTGVIGELPICFFNNFHGKLILMALGITQIDLITQILPNTKLQHVLSNGIIDVMQDQIKRVQKLDLRTDIMRSYDLMNFINNAKIRSSHHIYQVVLEMISDNNVPSGLQIINNDYYDSEALKAQIIAKALVLNALADQFQELNQRQQQTLQIGTLEQMQQLTSDLRLRKQWYMKRLQDCIQQPQTEALFYTIKDDAAKLKIMLDQYSEQLRDIPQINQAQPQPQRKFRR